MTTSGEKTEGAVKLLNSLSAFAAMPRAVRIDYPGLIQHVIIRGIG
jgi:hypothetical protein